MLCTALRQTHEAAVEMDEKPPKDPPGKLTLPKKVRCGDTTGDRRLRAVHGEPGSPVELTNCRVTFLQSLTFADASLFRTRQALQRVPARPVRCPSPNKAVHFFRATPIAVHLGAHH
mmetsp:Transcript_11276/g.24947  ORF Transcript_11276/g.24947 Transcript_11276/m.24947 type:complete len:117 (-) Transcript_11276:229-579(-)